MTAPSSTCDCLELIARMCRDLHVIAVHHHLEHDLSRVADEVLAVQCIHRIERAVQAAPTTTG
jgi:hypothetical protein